MVLLVVVDKVGGNLSPKLDWELANPKWAATINPILALPILNGTMIDTINLTSGVPLAINHLLQRNPQGWFLVDNTANASVWRTQPFNKNTLTLQSSATTTISIWVF
jgi:hypothetical protein